MTSIRKLSPSLEIKAQRELNEVPSRVPSDIQALREWLKKQPHLQSVNPSDQWLVGFLRGNKFSLERSKEKLDLYYTLRTLVPEINQNKDPFDSTIQEILQMGYYLPLKTTETDDAYRIIITRFNNASHHLVDILKVQFMIFEILILEDDNYAIAGLVIETIHRQRCVVQGPSKELVLQLRDYFEKKNLVNLEGAGMNIFIQWTPATAKKVLTCIEKAFPLRMKGIHIVHTPPGFESAYAILKTFLSEKFKQRFSIHTKFDESIYNEFPRKVLPREYGGENGTIQELIDHWKAKVESYREWFLLEDEQRSDETLRLGEPKTSSSLFGVEGSFRKLEVD